MPIKLDKVYFGPAGVPHSSKKKDTISGIKTVRELGLDAMEVEFVYGVKIKEDKAKEVYEVAKENNVILTIHAPYYINLVTTDRAKLERSKNHIINSLKIGNIMGVYSVVFHPGWYKDTVKEEAYRRVKKALEEIVEIMKQNNWDLWLRPETMEMQSKFGELDEVIKLSQELDNVLPCIDFAHLRYRHNMNDRDFYRSIMEKLEKELGKEILENMHIHISGIKLDAKGTHLNFDEADIKWRDILDVLKEFKIKGVIISESPNLEEDALKMKKYWYGF